MTEGAKSDGEIFRSICCALFGEDFGVSQVELAMDINERSVRRFLSGTLPIPPSLWDELRGALTDRDRLIKQIVTELDEHIKHRV